MAKDSSSAGHIYWSGLQRDLKTRQRGRSKICPVCMMSLVDGEPDEPCDVTPRLYTDWGETIGVLCCPFGEIEQDLRLYVYLGARDLIFLDPPVRRHARETAVKSWIVSAAPVASVA